MLRLDEVRLLYPEYAGMTDYELSSAVHQARYPDMPYASFAEQFRGPMQEDPDAVAVRNYNLRHPDQPIRREDMGKSSILSDIGDSIMAGAQELGGDALWALGQGAGAVGLDSAAGILGSAGRALHGWAEDTRRSMSPEMRIARDKQYLIDVPEEQGGGWRMGDAWTDPRSILGTVAESLPSMAGGIGVGGLIARKLLARGMSKGLAYAIGHGIGEGGVAGMQDSSQVHRQVMEMPYDTLAKSPEFQQLMEQYQDPEQARKALADSIAGTVAVDAGIAVGLMGAPMGGVYGRMLGGQTGKTLARTVGRHAIGEAMEETPQSAYEQHSMQSQLQRADPSIDPWSGVANAAVQGGLAGAFTGGVMGVPGHIQGQRVRDGLLAVIPESELEAAKEMSTDDLIKMARGYDSAAVDSILGIKPDQGNPPPPPTSPQGGGTSDFDTLISVPAWDGSRPSLDQQWDEEAARRGWTHLQSEESLSRDKTVDISPLWTPPSNPIVNPASPELNQQWDDEAQRRGQDDLRDAGTSTQQQPADTVPNDFEAALAAGTPPSKDEILSSLPPQMAQRVQHWSETRLQGLWDEYQVSPDDAASIIDLVEAQEAQQAGQGQGQPQQPSQPQDDMTPEELEDALLEADTETQVQQSPLDDALSQIDTGLQKEITAAERRQQSVAERRRAILDQLPDDLRQEYQGDSLSTLEKVLAKYQDEQTRAQEEAQRQATLDETLGQIDEALEHEIAATGQGEVGQEEAKQQQQNEQDKQDEKQDEKKDEELPPPPPPVDVQNDVVRPQSDDDVASATDNTTDDELANLEDELPQEQEEKPAEKPSEEKPTQQTPQATEASETPSEVESKGTDASTDASVAENPSTVPVPPTNEKVEVAEAAEQAKPAESAAEQAEQGEQAGQVESKAQAEPAEVSQQQEETSPPKSVKEQREELVKRLPPEMQDKASVWSLSRLKREVAEERPTSTSTPTPTTTPTGTVKEGDKLTIAGTEATVIEPQARVTTEKASRFAAHPENLEAASAEALRQAQEDKKPRLIHFKDGEWRISDPQTVTAEEMGKDKASWSIVTPNGVRYGVLAKLDGQQSGDVGGEKNGVDSEGQLQEVQLPAEQPSAEQPSQVNNQANNQVNPQTDNNSVNGQTATGQTVPEQTASEQAEVKQTATDNATDDTTGSTTNATTDDYGTVDRPNTTRLSDHFAERLSQGHSYKTINDARNEAGQLLKGKVEAGSKAVKDVDEAVELGVVKAARKMIETMRKDGKSDVDIYRALVDLYQRQPNLGSRTSTSVSQQAYSTPVPLAFLASRLAGINEQTSVYEPTAGNGMLLIESNTGKVHANELNEGRAERLRSQNFATVTQMNAVEDTGAKDRDVLIANPPFGSAWNNDHTQTVEMDVDGFKTKELDQAIVARGLQALKDGGRAVVIIGGKRGDADARAQAYRSRAQVNFYKHLYDNYNVRDHFSIDGSLYQRQGTKYPIDVLVIDKNGKSEGRLFPGGNVPRVYHSFEELESLIRDGIPQQATTPPTTPPSAPQNQQSTSTSTPTSTPTSMATETATATATETGTQAETPTATPKPVTQEEAQGATGVPASTPETTQSTTTPTQTQAQEQTQQAQTQSKPSSQKAQKAQKETKFQVPYEPASKLNSMGTLTPKGMATAVRSALAEVEDKHGAIDDYVAKELGMTKEEVANRFGAEQVDAIGLAISNMSEGKGFIIGDQTGIGKGRVNAAIIRWAKQKGKVPVFITFKKELYADMVRDLRDIGMEGFTPLPTDSGLVGDNAIQLPDGRVLTTKTGAAHKKLLESIARNGLGKEYDAVFTTYAQLQSTGKGDVPRRRFLESLAQNAVFILDESHNAGGGSQSRSTSGNESVAKFIRSLIQKSPNGVFYSSATYAKRPDVMDLCSKTDMRYAVNDINSLGEAISKGGIPMQQVVATMLTDVGQYIRRERSFEGAEVETTSIPVDTKISDRCSGIMQNILKFDRRKQEALKTLNDKEAGFGSSIGDNRGANEAAFSSTSFGSVMHNLIAQTLLAQKVDAVVQSAVDAVKNKNMKPVITLSNTMESMITEYANDNGIKNGDTIDVNFNDLLRRYLRKVREVTKKDYEGKVTERRLLTNAELGSDAVKLYNETMKMIDTADLSSLSVSFIDKIIAGLEAAGLRVGEITGRKTGIDYRGKTPTLYTRDAGTKERINAINGFNDGSIDVMILNSSGSTGISLHASEKFNDQRRRMMIIAQADLNIDTFMQTLGRVFRTGQVVPPTYQLMYTNLPAEKRPAAVLAKKMGSLNANTTASKDSDTTFKNIPDFINKYGDNIAVQTMLENPEIHEALGKPLNLKGDSAGAMVKLTGYIPLLSTKEQAQLYDLLESNYKELVAQLEAMGDLDLEAKILPLDAKLVSKQTLVQKKEEGGDSPFANSAEICVYDCKKLGKPFPPSYVQEAVNKSQRENPVNDIYAKLEEDFRRFVDKRRKDFKGDDFSAEEARFNEQLETVQAFINDYPPGRLVSVSNNGGDVILGMVMSLYNDGKAKSPVAYSSWKVDIALADAAKKITTSLSKIINGRESKTFELSRSTFGTTDSFYRLLEAGQSESREKVVIATGNILAANERLEGGKRVIFFTDHEGNTIPGIRMPAGTDVNAILGDMNIALTPEQAIKFLKTLTENNAVVKTEDGGMIISRSWGGYTLLTPASKSKGGQYFLNGKVLEAAGQEFIKTGSSMVIQGLDEKRTAAVLSALAEQGYGFIADNNKETAREITGKKLPKDIRASLRPSIGPVEFLPYAGAQPEGVVGKENVQRIVDTLQGDAQNAVPTVIVPTFDDLPLEVRKRFERDADTLEGTYYNGTVYLVSGNLHSEQRVAEVWTHEQIAHNGLRGLTTPEGLRTLMGRLWLGMGGMGNPLVKEIAERYGIDPRSDADDRTTVMEEVVARLAEKKAKGLLNAKEKTFWRRIVDAVRRLWDRLVTRVTGKSSAMRAENVDDLLTALGRYVMDGIGGVAEQTGTASTSTSTEAPLASLSSTAKAIADKVGSVVNTETVAAATRGLRKIAKRGVSADVEAILQDPDMGKLVEKEDMGMLERVFKLPYWIAREKNPFTPIYERQQERMEDKVAATSKDIGSMSLLFDEDRKKQLDEKGYKGLTAMIHKWDGKPIFALNGVDKFLVTGQGVNGRDVLAINPEFRRKFNAWLQTQNEPEKVKEAFRQVRETLDDAFLKAYNRMAEMSEIADTDIEMYRTEFGSIHNYFPHHRKGKYFVIATKGQGVVGDPKKTVFRKHFDVPFGSSVREEWAKIVAENRGKPEFAGATWENPREVEKLPDDILGAPLDPQAMEQIIKTALQKVQDPTQREKIQKMMLEGIADTLKARGWGAHGIKRQGIPGYEMDDIKGVLYDYFNGLNGWLAKMDAARDFAQGLGKIDAAKTPRLWEYASQYVKDMLRNSDRTDKLAGNIKTLAFAWYLGGNLKTAAVNATQNVIIGAPRLGQYVGGGYRRWLKGAADTIGIHYTRQGIKGARKLTADEEAMLERLYGSGIINAAYMDELQGQLTDSPVLKGWRKFVALLGKPMAMVECFNRASLALAAYRAAKEGSWRPFAEQELGVRNGQGMSNEDAEAFASMIVRDSHFEYGRGNMPEYLRSNWTGRALSPVYTFRSFGSNALNLWYRALTKEGMAGKKFVAQTLGATIALGGLTSLPFFATLSALCGALSGDDEDWKTKVRRTVGKDDMRQNMVLYGLPSLAGFTLSGSLRMETPLTEGLEKGKTLKDVFDQSLLSLLGIPRDLYVKASRAAEAHGAGNDYKAVEALVPTFAANVMKAYRMATEGQTTMKGKPITEPGGKEARKLTRWEAGGQALGFQPVSNAESYERYQAEQRAKARRTEMIDRLAGMFNEGREPGNDGRARMMRELRKWNEEMEAAGRMGMRISPKNVYTRAKNKRNPRKPSAVDKGMQRDWMAMTGS